MAACGRSAERMESERQPKEMVGDPGRPPQAFIPRTPAASFGGFSPIRGSRPPPATPQEGDLRQDRNRALRAEPRSATSEPADDEMRSIEVSTSPIRPDAAMRSDRSPDQDTDGGDCVEQAAAVPEAASEKIHKDDGRIGEERTGPGPTDRHGSERFGRGLARESRRAQASGRGASGGRRSSWVDQVGGEVSDGVAVGDGELRRSGGRQGRSSLGGRERCPGVNGTDGVIRAAKEADLEALTALAARVNGAYADWAGPAWKPPAAARELTHWQDILASATGWGAVLGKDEELVGCASLKTERGAPGAAPISYLSRLLTGPGHRRLGYGSALLAAACEEMRRRGSSAGELLTPAANRVARSFYRHAGWEFVGEAGSWQGLPLLRYRLDL
jgi:ribosomal protein S18 acetylase RimI-like enzyme